MRNMFLNTKKQKQKPRHKDSKNTSISGRGNHTIYLGINAFISVIVIVVTDFVIKLCVNIKMHACSGHMIRCNREWSSCYKR